MPLFPLLTGPTGRNLVVDASGFLVATGESGSGVFILGFGDTGRPLAIDGLGRLVLSPESPGLVSDASNVGTGSGLFKQQVNTVLQFNTISAGANIFINKIGDNYLIETIPPSGTGTVDDAVSGGLGSGLISTPSKIGTTLIFKTLVPGSGFSIEELDIDQYTIGLNQITFDKVNSAVQTVAGAAFGASVFEVKIDDAIFLRDIVAGSGIIVTEGIGTILVQTSGLELTAVQNVIYGGGPGSGLTDSKLGTDVIQFGLIPGSGFSIERAMFGADYIVGLDQSTFDAVNSAVQNVIYGGGPGSGLTDSKLGTDVIQFGLIPGSGFSIERAMFGADYIVGLDDPTFDSINTALHAIDIVVSSGLALPAGVFGDQFYVNGSGFYRHGAFRWERLSIA